MRWTKTDLIVLTGVVVAAIGLVAAAVGNFGYARASKDPRSRLCVEELDGHEYVYTYSRVYGPGGIMHKVNCKCTNE